MFNKTHTSTTHIKTVHTKNTLCTLLILIFSFFSSVSHANAATNHSHGFALWGKLKYPPNFTHFEYVNPEAPKGGTLRLMGYGSFDTLNPYTLKGTSPHNSPGMFVYGFSELNETLLAGTGSYSPSGDEPQSAYGLIAESLSYPDDISSVTFTLRPEARFHDAHQIDSQDVVYSFYTLTEKGHPRFKQTFSGVDKVVALTPNQVKFVFKESGRGANILRAGELPILPKHFWEDKDFEKSASIVPLLSGPYKIKDFKLGNSLRLERVKEPWFANINGQELGIYRGRYNFDEVLIDFYRDQAVAFEGFKSDSFDLFFDYTAKNWAKAYDFPAIKDGRVKKEEIAHEIPSTTQAFFFNTRRDVFKDRRIRQAISLMFDYEWTNKALFNSAYKRNLSFFPNSDFSANGAPNKDEIDIIESLNGTFVKELKTESFSLPVTQGNGNIRQQQKEALGLLKSAGWQIKNGTLTNKQSGKPFKFEILIRQAGIQRVLMPFIKNLSKIGIEAIPRMVDTAQYKVRIDQFDFDMTTVSLSQGLAPSYEQRDYFHSSTASIEGSQNYAGIQNPAIDQVIEKVLSAKSYDKLSNAMRVLDRLLLWEHYTIPNWHLNYHRLASWQRFHRPAKQPAYTLGVENWWSK